jgi:KaiC/GvpD/RAD55 family RecA-like ATPase
MRSDFARQGLGYVMSVPEIATEFAVDRMTRRGGETHGELTVTCGLPGSRSTDGHLHQARFNLSSTTARTGLAKTLAHRSKADEIDWFDLLETFCRGVLSAEREGDPISLVGALPIPVGETYRLHPLLPEGQVTILYGDGGTGKSTLAAAIAASVETGVTIVDNWTPRRAAVLYLDWEAGKASINRRVRGVAMGAGIPSVVQIRHADCRRRGPIAGFAEDVARYIDREEIGLIIVDSIGMASGTSNEGSDANESAIRLFSAFGFLGTTILAIDHISKAAAEDSGKPARPYGSIYKGLLARATYELRRSTSGDGRSLLGVFNTKANDGPLLAPMTFSVIHGDDGSIRYETLEVTPTEMTAALSNADKIAAVLHGKHMLVSEIADETGLSEAIVRTTLNRGKDYRFGALPGPTHRWELLPPRKASA